jgi:3-hydroxyacyl-[acyl-carrier-protein] dehydratase
MWIDRVTELERGHRMVAIKNVSLAEEHLHDHFAATEVLPSLPVMPATLIIEGMAQTAGMLVGHANHFREKVVLAKVSRAELDQDVGPGHTLRYTATIERMDEGGASTLGTVELIDPAERSAPRVIGRIDLIFSHLDRNRTGQTFPGENFVFSEAFQTLLQSSGFTV